ncbi:MAG: hypothetical protein C7B46_00755 [Sulfobacillus benefaciens]|uniref:Uncharacterized protein n=1 Tax=Sulfobacillus benefaciens TaxID=453960 RepID=A0A2T2XM23_9FIRM|nr:MAG: hypothetical protein C7B46_00755 [Sulfobacillus benefaciens]
MDCHRITLSTKIGRKKEKVRLWAGHNPLKAFKGKNGKTVEDTIWLNQFQIAGVGGFRRIRHC